MLTLFVLLLLMSCAHGFENEKKWDNINAKEAELTIRMKIDVGDAETVKIICPFGKNLNESYITEIRGAFVRPISVCMLSPKDNGSDEQCGLMENLNQYGCTPYWRNVTTSYALPSHIVPTKGSKEPWVVFVKRGFCMFETKMKIAKEEGASAIVVYNTRTEDHTQYYIPVPDSLSDVPIVNIGIEDANKIINLFNFNRLVDINIRATGNDFRYPRQTPKQTFSKTTVLVLVVATCVIVLMITFLARLLFYCVKRCRYSHRKGRLAAHHYDSLIPELERAGAPVKPTVKA